MGFWSGAIVIEEVCGVARVVERPVVTTVTRAYMWDVPAELLPKALGYRLVQHLPNIRASVWALWWAAPFVRTWLRARDRWYGCLRFLCDRRVLYCGEGELLSSSRPNCWPWKRRNEEHADRRV